MLFGRESRPFRRFLSSCDDALGLTAYGCQRRWCADRNGWGVEFGTHPQRQTGRSETSVKGTNGRVNETAQ